MRRPTQFRQRTALKFNITPLIDVVFLLIIFFLVASHFVRSEQAEPVELPLAGSGQMDDEQALHRLTITIDQDGNLFVNGEGQSEAAVYARIAQLQKTAAEAQVEPEVRIRPDKRGRHGPFRRIYVHCAKHNIRNIQLAVATDGQL